MEKVKVAREPREGRLHWEQEVLFVPKGRSQIPMMGSHIPLGFTDSVPEAELSLSSSSSSPQEVFRLETSQTHEQELQLSSEQTWKQLTVYIWPFHCCFFFTETQYSQ